MADVLLFHHALGLTDGVHALADRLRAGGHDVTTPDLYDGHTFADVSEGVAHAQRIGFDTVLERGVRAAAAIGGPTVFAGISLGVVPAQRLAQTHEDARAAVLLEACLPAEEFGGWPVGLPVQVHGMDDDEFFAHEGDIDAAREIVAAAEDGELFTYPGDRHLFTDAGTDGYDASATDRVVERVLGLLERL